MYNVIMHTHLEEHHLHTKKRETHSQKINSYKRQKGLIVGGIDKSKSLKKKTQK